LTIGGAGAGAPPVVNSQNGSDVAFFVTKNRLQNVKVDAFVQETGARN
jgi:hypothetical protein